jgi:TrmH family RNA methyltransferase
VMRDIAGRQNHSVKLARKLQHKKHRRERGLLVCEGMDLLAAAVESCADIKEVLVRGDLADALPQSLLDMVGGDPKQAGVPGLGLCDQATLDYASSLGGSADVIFICGQPRLSLSDVDLGGGLTFYLDGVGDPGNVGTIVRSALAFGLAGVICSPGTADPYGPKAMRAGMGAQFALPVVTEVSPDDLAARLGVLRGKGGSEPGVWAAEPCEGEDVRSAELNGAAIVVLGAERTGPSSAWAGEKRLTIPQHRFESLNVAMAGTVLAYEWWRRQRAAAVANEESVR